MSDSPRARGEAVGGVRGEDEGGRGDRSAAPPRPRGGEGRVRRAPVGAHAIVQGFSCLVGWISSRDSLAAGAGWTSSKISHLSLASFLSLTRTTYISCSSWWSQSPKLPFRPFTMSKVAPFSK